MRFPLAIVAASLALAACAAPAPGNRDRPRSGVALPTAPAIAAVGTWWPGAWPDRLRFAAAHRGLLREDSAGRIRADLARSWSRRTGKDGAPCWRFRLDGVDAAAVASAWTSRLSDGDPALAALLQGVRGVAPAGQAGPPSGLRPRGRVLTVCTARPDPGLPRRLAHPAAWAVRRAVAIRDDGPKVGFGPPADGDAAADAPVRVPAWDGTYALWMDPRARWAADPTFRTWLARTVDREDLARVALAGRGEPAFALTDDPDAGLPDGPGDAPVSAGARPRLTVAHDAADPVARSVLSRLKATLAGRGIDLILRAEDRVPAADPTDRRPDAAALILHRPGSSDPALGLLETLAGLGPEATASADELRARPFDPETTRTVRARAVEWSLVHDGLLIPLVRVHGWVADDALSPDDAVPGGGLVAAGSGR